jgi:hypothetical protein
LNIGAKAGVMAQNKKSALLVPTVSRAPKSAPLCPAADKLPEEIDSDENANCQKLARGRFDDRPHIQGFVEEQLCQPKLRLKQVLHCHSSPWNSNSD